MKYPATGRSATAILEGVHATLASSKTKFTACTQEAAARRLAAYLVARNIPISALMDSNLDALDGIAGYFLNLPAYGAPGTLPDIKLTKPVTIHKREKIETLHQAAKFGVVGVLAAFFAEDVQYYKDGDPGEYRDWFLPHRCQMMWSAPRLVVRHLPATVDKDTVDMLFRADVFDEDIDLTDEEQQAITDHTIHMMFHNAVEKYLSICDYCPSEGYALTVGTGRGTPSQYIEQSTDDILPEDVVKQMNSIAYFDPPNMYLRTGDRQYEGVHTSCEALPPLGVLSRAASVDYNELPEATREQISGDNSKSSQALASSKYIEVYVPREIACKRDPILLALDFATQHLFKAIGALTPACTAGRVWHKYYLDTDYAYADFAVKHQAIAGVVVENGAYSAHLTRLSVDRSDDGAGVSISFVILADRGFMRDKCDDLGQVLCTIDNDHRYTIDFEYSSEWRPTGPGLGEGDPDQAPPSSAEAVEHDVSPIKHEYAPFSAYKVTIRKED